MDAFILVLIVGLVCWLVLVIGLVCWQVGVQLGRLAFFLMYHARGSNST